MNDAYCYESYMKLFFATIAAIKTFELKDRKNAFQSADFTR